MSRVRSLRTLPWHLRYRTGATLASGLRRLSVLATHRHCRVVLERPTYLGPGFHLRIPESGEFIVAPGVEFRRGFGCEISGNGRVSIGSGSAFTWNVIIQCSTTIEIGEGCVFAQSVLIADGNHRFRDPSKPMVSQGYDFRPIKIGDRANVMAKCTVLADIGEGSFIGANSVVTKPIPAYCLAVGAPARVVDYFGPPESRPAGLDVDRHA